MNWTIFWIILIVGVILFVAWMFYSQREIAYLSILLYRQGNADAYLKELDTFQGKLFFNKRLRSLMSIDAWMMKEDAQKLDEAFAYARDHRLPMGDRLLVLQKELVYCAQNGKIERGEDVFAQIEKLYESMGKKQQTKYANVLAECKYTSSIDFHKNGKYADELEKKAKEVKEDIPSGVYYYKAAQSWYLKKETKNCREDLEKAAQKLKETPNEQIIRNLLNTKDLAGILNVHF